ncbi:ent-kaur-16-ene synthase, chloroplastic-like [Phalaenopsis equestris]|uniref:ent-kaur-16-ene synthase, chloroplastic-like n=1 Tax=Phalaenopsis equestris TaxID=78828 RepID=UPI0009E2747B|nr:ent-kaur-16-ene synthase, chloroplastic-like [Phalaenopsis equestris]
MDCFPQQPGVPQSLDPFPYLIMQSSVTCLLSLAISCSLFPVPHRSSIHSSCVASFQFYLDSTEAAVSLYFCGWCQGNHLAAKMFSIAVSPAISFVGVGRSRVYTYAFERNSVVNAGGPQAILDHGQNDFLSADDPNVKSGRFLEKIRERLLKVELSVSAYDTAWVSMVPSSTFPRTPYFPECLDWIMDNQLPDGSWVPTHHKPSITKDILSSTLACVLALWRWKVGEEYVKKGLSFIGTNFFSSVNERQQSPVGFSIIFPGMISYAINMGLDLPLRESDIDAMLSMREEKLGREVEKNMIGSKAYLAFVAEGLCGLHDWKEVMSYQRKNGSLFNSPSTTAAALCHIRDDKSLNYLSSVLQKFGCSVPTTYPFDIHMHLSVVDKLERLGVSLHFIHDIRGILDRAYRCWVDKDEEIYLNIATCAMSFRLLRLHGYDVSSDALAPFADMRHFKNTLQGYIRDLNAIIELYKASQVQISPEEAVLKKLNSWVTHFLKEELNTNANHSLDILQEVDHTLGFPFYASMERLEHKLNIEHYNSDKLHMLKSSFVYSMKNNDLLKLAVHTFNTSQLTYKKELQYLESWVKESKFNQLGFSRQKQIYCYLSAVMTFFSSETSSARICWAQCSTLITVIDDFFDFGGSSEELANLIKLVEKWHGVQEKDFCSENVKIIFFALYNTINELGAKASLFQKRDVTKDIINVVLTCCNWQWLVLLSSEMKEAEWRQNSTFPTFDEYMTSAIPSFALGPIILPSIYLAVPELLENIIGSPEYKNLLKLLGKFGRLINDIQGYQREKATGKLNSLWLIVHHGNGSISEEDARKHMWSLIDSTRAELLGLVLQNKGSVVPRACKEVFWKTCKAAYIFYRNNDGFTSPTEMDGTVNAVIYEPLKVSHLSQSQS